MADTIDNVESLDELGIRLQRLEDGLVSAGDSDEGVAYRKKLRNFKEQLDNYKGCGLSKYKHLVNGYNQLVRERASEGE